MDTSTQFTDETETKYIVSVEYLRYLQRRDFELDCLEQGGVDNWSYYYDSLKDGGFFDNEND